MLQLLGANKNIKVGAQLKSRETARCCYDFCCSIVSWQFLLMVNGESFSIHVPHTIPLKKGYLDNSSFPLSKRQALLIKTAIDRSTTDQIRARCRHCTCRRWWLGQKRRKTIERSRGQHGRQWPWKTNRRKLSTLVISGTMTTWPNLSADEEKSQNSCPRKLESVYV